MKLLFINYEFPPLGGGGGRANAQIARQMVGMGHEVVVLTSAFADLPRQEVRDGYTIVRIPTLRRHLEKCRIYEMIAFMISSIFYSVRWGKKFKPDRTIAFFTIPSGPAALVLRWLYHIPYIVSLRGGDVPGFMKEQLKLYHKICGPLIRLIWKKAQTVVANSEGLKDLALQTGRNIDIEMIPNGVDFDFFKQDDSSELVPTFVMPGGGYISQSDESISENDKPLKILTVGRLSSQKGIDVLLKAFHLMKQEVRKPVKLLIVGDGPLKSELQSLSVALDLQEDVLFLGWVEQSSLKALYAGADLFVLPSLYEGMPNVILEAMAMGLPIIATDIAGSREIVQSGENGHLVPVSDVKALAQQMIHLMHREDLLDDMSLASRKMAQAYDWRNVAADYLELCS